MTKKMDRKPSDRSSNKRSRSRNQSKQDKPEHSGLVGKFLRFFGFVDDSKSKTANRKLRNEGQSGKRGSGKGGKKKRASEKLPATSEKLFVGNLSYSVNEDELKEIFESAGTVEKAEVVVHRQSKRSKGFGFVTMSSLDEAKEAISLLDGKELDGRELSVSGAKSDGRKDSRPRNNQTSTNRGDSRKSSGGGRRNDSRGNDSRSSGYQAKGDSRGGRGRGRGRGRGGRQGRGGSRRSSADSLVTPMDVPVVSSTRLSMNNLAKDFGEAELGDLFAGVAKVTSSDIQDGRAFIEMASIEDAQNAVRLLDGKDFMGQTLSVLGEEEASSWASSSD